MAFAVILIDEPKLIDVALIVELFASAVVVAFTVTVNLLVRLLPVESVTLTA